MATQQELKKTVDGIRSRTPNRPEKFYDEPNGNERRLRGIAKRTPKRTMLIDEADAKESPRKVASQRSRGPSKATYGTSYGTLARAKASKADIPVEKWEARTKTVDETPLKQLSSAGKSIPKSTSAATPAATQKKSKKRGKLRRAASAVGRGLRRAFTGGGGKRQAQKRESNQGTKKYA